MMARWPEKDDHALMRLIQEGNHQAFATLVRRHSERFYRLAYRYVADRGVAEDIVQEAFLKLWERPEQWDGERTNRFTTWLYRIVVHLCLDWQKKKRPQPLGEEALIEDQRPAQDETIVRGQQQQALEREISALPERQRTALNLCFYEGLSNKAAAQVMGVELKALQSLIMRAKTTLKTRLKAWL
jgi:RNA polymerase sigma-70 factor (ECF subfamily)